MKRVSLYRIVAAVTLALVVAVLLWFASPVTESANAYNNRGFVYNNQGKYEKAIATLNKAIELDSGLAEAYNNRAWAYIELEQYEQAIADCNKAIELDPTLTWAYNNRDWAYSQLE